MFLAVSPTDQNFVIIGGTNLYRSTDGFATSAANTSANWIGGYAVINNVSQYANHHADQHSGFFGTGNTYFSGHDGGLSKTTDITAAAVTWTNVDDTYNVGQFYTISLAPEMNSTYMSGGLQDNGVRFTTAGGLSDWTEWQGGGDGAFTEVAPIGDDRVYTSTQNGNIAKFTRNNDFKGEMNPPGFTNPLFINPFILDHNSSSLIYYGAGNSASTSGIWRNSNPTPEFDNSGWTFIASIDKDNDGQTSAIDASYTNSANVVYFGTNLGKVFKIVGANAGTAPTLSNVSSNLPTGGYVSGIAIDPLNSNNVMVTFSNYNFNSIYYTSDGGINWTFVEGNLNNASGPSVRSCEIFQVSGVTHYFVGTSIGLYYTLTLNGTSTVWTQEASSTVGNNICAALDWRSDAGSIAKTASSDGIKAVTSVSLAIGTHGRGVFQGTIDAPLPVELTTFAGLYSGTSIELKWETATEVNNYGFEVEKSSDKNVWKKVGFVEGHGNSNSPKSYSFNDLDINGSEKFYYRLKQIDIDGKYEYSKVVEVSVVVGNYSLSQNYPNPFNPSTKINYTIPETANVKVEVFSVTGELVTQLVNLQQNAGNYSVEFNTSSYSNLSSGLYIYRINVQGLSGNKFSQTRKMLLLK
jgi:hypothetical protein